MIVVRNSMSRRDHEGMRVGVIEIENITEDSLQITAAYSYPARMSRNNYQYLRVTPLMICPCSVHSIWLGEWI